MKLLIQEEQIKKGKTIIEHNKTISTKEEQKSEQKRKEVLERHLEEVRKGTELLKKKIKIMRDSNKKHHQNKVIFDENQLELELNQF
jgi:hypothetical protein